MSTRHSGKAARPAGPAARNAFSEALGEGRDPTRQQLASELAASRSEIAALKRELEAEQNAVSRLGRDRDELALRAAQAINRANEVESARDLFRAELERMGLDVDDIELRVVARDLGVDLGHGSP